MFTLEVSSQNMPCIRLTNPTEEDRIKIRDAVMENRMDHPAYTAKSTAVPFLQADYPEYLLVEFWGRDPQPFMNYLNNSTKVCCFAVGDFVNNTAMLYIDFSNRS